MDAKKIAALATARGCVLRNAVSIRNGETPRETRSPIAAEKVFATSSLRVYARSPEALKEDMRLVRIPHGLASPGSA